jgi:hypothetical protein
MLNDAHIRDFEDIVSWIPAETEVTSVFKVHDKTKFEESILPKYFSSTKYRSFQRQLNLYRFARQDKKGEYGDGRGIVLYCSVSFLLTLSKFSTSSKAPTRIKTFHGTKGTSVTLSRGG